MYGIPENELVSVPQYVRDAVVLYMQAENKGLGYHFNPQVAISDVASGKSDKSYLVQAFAKVANMNNKKVIPLTDATATGLKEAIAREPSRLKYYPDYIDDPDGLERFRQDVLSNRGHAMAAVNHNSLGRLIDTIERLRRERDAALLPSASVDQADIKETIEDAADDWQAKGYTSALAEVRDMAAVGRSLMEALPKGYSYMDSPAEIVTDLQNELDEARATPSASVGGEREVSVISLADALAVVDRCTPAQAGGMFSHTNSMRCIADDIRKGIAALAAPETPPTKEGEV